MWRHLLQYSLCPQRKRATVEENEEKRGLENFVQIFFHCRVDIDINCSKLGCSTENRWRFFLGFQTVLGKKTKNGKFFSSGILIFTLSKKVHPVQVLSNFHDVSIKTSEIDVSAKMSYFQNGLSAVPMLSFRAFKINHKSLEKLRVQSVTLNLLPAPTTQLSKMKSYGIGL